MFNFLINEAGNLGRTPINWFTEWFYSPNFVGDIKKYAICILAGVIIAYFVCTIEGEKQGIKRSDILDCIIIVVPLCILGARIWYLCFDGEQTFMGFMKDYGFFKAILYIVMYTIGFTQMPLWHFTGIQGLAIHGGIVTAIISALICSRIKKWKINRILDMLAPGLILGQMSGRWGNFFNKEAHGTVIGGFNEADLLNNVLTPNLSVAEQYNRLINQFHVPKWIANNMYVERAYYDFGNGITLPVESANYYHPTFLYEFLWNALYLIMYFIFRRTKFWKSGLFLPTYLIWYGVGRFFIETIRMDSLYTNLFNLKAAQVTSILMIVAGIALVLYILLSKKSENYLGIIKEIKAEKALASSEVEEKEVANDNAVPQNEEKPDKKE